MSSVSFGCGRAVGLRPVGFRFGTARRSRFGAVSRGKLCSGMAGSGGQGKLR